MTFTDLSEFAVEDPLFGSGCMYLQIMMILNFDLGESAHANAQAEHEEMLSS